MRSHSAFPFPPILSIFCVILFFLSLPSPHHAAPIRSAQAVPDHWAQLLLADRYSLVKLPSRSLFAHEHPSEHLTVNTTSSNPLTFTSEERGLADKSEDFLPHTSARQVFSGKGEGSEIRCTVVNAPANMQIKTAISEVIAVMGNAWRSTVIVNARIEFADIGPATILATGGGTYFVRMTDKFKTLLPVAAAEAFRKRDLNDNQKGLGKFDVLIQVNTKTPWYIGPANAVGDKQYDLVTVILHEFYHNLVFAGSITATKRNEGPRIIQSASLFKNYLTRFDSFLSTEGGCAVLGYLSASSLASEVQMTTNQLLAEAICNGNLWWSVNRQKIAKLNAPRIFLRKSSVYHLDPDPKFSGAENSLMFPTVRRKQSQRSVGPLILKIQQYTLDPQYNGAITSCQLTNPKVRDAVPSDIPKADDQVHTGGSALIPPVIEEPGNRIAGLPIWAFVLIIIFAILLLLLLLSLCLMLCLRRRKKKTETFRSSKYSYTGSKSRVSGTGTRSGTGSGSKYFPGWGGKVSKSKTTVAHSSHHSKSSRKSSDHDDKRTKTTVDDHATGDTCPSSGKNRWACCCKCCMPRGMEVCKPPPVASVHTYDPDCETAPRRSHSHSRSHRHHYHKKHRCYKCHSERCCCKSGSSTTVGGASSHRQSPTKTLKKSCKSKSSRSCHRGCCKVTSGSSDYTCTRTTPKCSKTTKHCSRTPPSTKPPSSSKVCGHSAKASSSRCPPPTTKSPSCRSCKSPVKSGRCKCENIVEINVGYNC